MKENFPTALRLVLRHEGGYVNHPKDPGGATNRGITQGTYDTFRMRKGYQPKSVRDITDVEVAEIYKKLYWNVVDGDVLPSGLDYAVFDFAVNSGPVRAIRHLQLVVGAQADGRIGYRTMANINTMPTAMIIRGLTKSRMEFLRALGTWKTFGKGWTRRVLEVEKAALDLAAQKDVQVPVTPAPDAPVQQPKPGLMGLVVKLFTLIMELFRK